MIQYLVAWAIANVGFLTAIGALFVFLLFDGRKKSLEIEKLALEIKKLKEDSLIYRPNSEEIEKILEKTRHISTRRLGITGGTSELEVFGEELHHFLRVLSAYYGDSQSQLEISQQKLAAVMQHWPDPYPGGYERHPNPSHLVNAWREVRAVALTKLEPEIVQLIDAVLGRFSTSENAA